MRRPIFIATFVLTAALSVGWAQRGMRSGGAPARSGFSSRGPMMGAAPARFGSAPARFGGAPGTSTRFGGGMQFAGGFHAPQHGPNRFHPHPTSNHVHHHHGFNFVPAVNFRYRYPLYYGGYSSPWYWDWGSSYDSYESSQNDYAQRQMLRQIDDLSQEVQRLRQEQEYSGLTASSAAPPSPMPTPAPQATVEPPKIDSGLPVVLVFFDQKIQEIKNYAVINEMLVVFDGTRTRKIPLRDVDLAATMKLNDERGVDFQIPN